MKFKHNRLFKIILITVSVLVVWQFASYWAFGKQGRLTTLDRFLPQYTHYVKGTTFRFAFVPGITKRDMMIVKKTLAPHFKEIFFDSNAIPAELKEEHINDETGKVLFTGFNDGCSLNLDVKKSGFMWFQGWYSDYEGMLASSGRKATLVWILGRWWVVWTSGMMIS